MTACLIFQFEVDGVAIKSTGSARRKAQRARKAQLHADREHGKESWLAEKQRLHQRVAAPLDRHCRRRHRHTNTCANAEDEDEDDHDHDESDGSDGSDFDEDDDFDDDFDEDEDEDEDTNTDDDAAKIAQAKVHLARSPSPGTTPTRIDSICHRGCGRGHGPTGKAEGASRMDRAVQQSSFSLRPQPRSRRTERHR